MLTDKGWKEIESKESLASKCYHCKGIMVKDKEYYFGLVSEDQCRVILCRDHYFTHSIKGILRYEMKTWDKVAN